MEIKLSQVNRKEVLQYLNWRGSAIPEDIDLLIDSAIAELIGTVRPQYIWQQFVVEIRDGVPYLPELELTIPGNNVAELLQECSSLIFFAATLGMASERLIRSNQVRNFSRAIIFDCCGSAAIESVLDTMEQLISEKLPSGSYLTDRFSPGYGDLPLEFERPIVSILDTSRKIGLSLTDSCILLPRKSVTGIIGISSKPQSKRFRGCAYCSMFENCTFRKAGKTCGKT